MNAAHKLMADAADFIEQRIKESPELHNDMIALLAEGRSLGSLVRELDDDLLRPHAVDIIIQIARRNAP